MTKPRTLAFWSGPRNVSTALMYSFAQRSDTRVLDEPFFGAFLKTTGVWRPSREEVLQTMETSMDAVFSSLENEDPNQYLFLKNMANHTEGMDLQKILSYKNVILTRDPKKVITSYTEHIDHPTLLDLGYQHQLKIIEFLRNNKQPVLVVDSDEICKDPEQQLKRICKFLEISFDRSMLSWEAGARKEDGVWAKYWYKNVHSSKGFRLSTEKEYSVRKAFIPLYRESLELYNQIRTYYEQIQHS